MIRTFAIQLELPNTNKLRVRFPHSLSIGTDLIVVRLLKRTLQLSLYFILLLTTFGTPIFTESLVRADEKVEFDQYFEDRTLRLEFNQIGDATKLEMPLVGVGESHGWSENPEHLLMDFDYGQYRIKLLDQNSSRCIFSKGFDTLYGEYASTQKGIDGQIESFETTLRVPFPKKPVTILVEQRDKKQLWNPITSIPLDPQSQMVKQWLEADSRKLRDAAPVVIPIAKSGPAIQKVDLLFLAEGYQSSEQDKFKSDAERMYRKLMSCSPYSENQDSFNANAVFVPSPESGTDFPHRETYRNTAFDASFNTLDIQRYLLPKANHKMHRCASVAPYDALVVLVNSNVYGGGAIRLDYCITTVDFPTSETVFVHELGHSFAYLADEYIGNVTYNDVYPEGTEPPEPNLTRELNRDRMKWKSHLTPGIPLPTPIKSDAADDSQRRVGAFEGGGYLSTGIYRSEQICWMGQNVSRHGFCVACTDGIQEMIRFYTGK